MTYRPYLTRHQLRNLRAAQARAPFASPADNVDYMDQVTAAWPDPRTRPPGAAGAHDQAAARLAEKES